MPYLEIPSEKKVSEQARRALDEIGTMIARTSNFLPTCAHHLPRLQTNWEKLKGTIAPLVSEDSGQHRIRAHSAAFQSLGLEATPATEACNGQRALAALIRKANRRK